MRNETGGEFCLILSFVLHLCVNSLSRLHCSTHKSPRAFKFKWISGNARNWKQTAWKYKIDLRKRHKIDAELLLTTSLPSPAIYLRKSYLFYISRTDWQKKCFANFVLNKFSNYVSYYFLILIRLLVLFWLLLQVSHWGYFLLFFNVFNF